MTSEQQSLRDRIAPLFEGQSSGPFTVYLYGSRAQGNSRADSDYDFALIAPAPLDRAELEGLRESLENVLSSDVDCVDMRRVPLTLAAQVLESGIVLIPGDEMEGARLETSLMSMYAALNEERRGILEDIVARGSIHAR